MRKILLTLTLLTITILMLSCNEGKSPTTPTDTQDFKIAAARWNPSNTSIEAVNITVARTQDGAMELPGRDITMTATSGSVTGLTDHGDGTYDAVWTGAPEGEVTVVATDNDSDPVVQTSITFLALEYLDPEWEVPVKLAAPVSTDGWETASFLYPSGNNLAFAYITLDWVALAANIIRPIGEERPGQSIPQTLNIYIAERPAGVNPQWWTGWTVENAQVNLFQSLPMYLSAPMVTSDNSMAFCTVQEFNGLGYDPTTIYSLDSGFMNAPTALGPPVDMTGLGEDNPYYDVTRGWLYFDTYDLGDPLSKQNIWAAQGLEYRDAAVYR
ncbi:MAG: Ig-like domain-containing protein [bacterium]|nr:Ig-like domain-containing protein [bacterium]